MSGLNLLFFRWMSSGGVNTTSVVLCDRHEHIYVAAADTLGIPLNRAPDPVEGECAVCLPAKESSQPTGTPPSGALDG